MDTEPKFIKPTPRIQDEELDDKIHETRKILEELCVTESVELTTSQEDIYGLMYSLEFPMNNGTKVTLGITMYDYQLTDADLVIDTMTTLPDSETGEGYGTKVIEKIKSWAKEHNINSMCATQVSNVKAKNFLIKNGFVEESGNNKLGNFIFKL